MEEFDVISSDAELSFIDRGNGIAIQASGTRFAFEVNLINKGFARLAERDILTSKGIDRVGKAMIR